MQRSSKPHLYTHAHTLGMPWLCDYLSETVDVSSYFTHLTWLTANSLLWLGCKGRVSDCSANGEQEWICLRMLVLNTSLICLMLPTVEGCGYGLLNRSSASQKYCPVRINEDNIKSNDTVWGCVGESQHKLSKLHEELVWFRWNTWERPLIFPVTSRLGQKILNAFTTRHMWQWNATNDQKTCL